MRELLPRFAWMVLDLAVVTGAVACQGDAPQGPGTGTAAAKASVQPSGAAAGAGSGQAAIAQGSAATAADQMFPRLERLGALVDQSKVGDRLDCKKLGDELTKYAEQNQQEIAKLRDGAGGKPALESALKSKFGQKYEALVDKILEATSIDCKGEATVQDATRKLDL